MKNKIQSLEDAYNEYFEKIKKQILMKANSHEIMEKLFKDVRNAST